MQYMESKKQTFLCSSANWETVVEDASTFDEAAAIALQRQLDSDSNNFSVGAVISVVPIVKNTKETRFVYAPAVLADVGMHKYADELIKQIDKDTDNEKGKG